MIALLNLRPGHEEEDHDHIMCNGREVLRVDYGEVDTKGRGIGGLGPREISRLVRAVNRAHAKSEAEWLRLRGEEAAIGLAERRRADKAEARLVSLTTMTRPRR